MVESRSDGEESYKPYTKTKPYLMRLKRHQDAILALHSPQGITGSLVVSGSADERLRIWDMKEKRISKSIPFGRPQDSHLMKYRNMANDSLPRFSAPNMIDMAEEAKEKTQGRPKPGDDIYDDGPLKGLPKRMQHDFPTCLVFCGPLVLSGYEDGLICCWDIESGNFNFPMIGHSNRVNHMLASETHQFIYSSANDCTVRRWDVLTGVCENIYKFADPISVIKMKEDWNYMFTASWDKMVRVIDLDKQLTVKSFVASKETIKEMLVTGDGGDDSQIIVAGCEPIIRSYKFATGDSKIFQGHRGWVYCIIMFENKLFSGGDDNVVRVWDINTQLQLEELQAHRNGVTSIVLANDMLFTASFDHYLVGWDFPAMLQRINEKKLMRIADIESRKIEVYHRVMDEKASKKNKQKGAFFAQKSKQKKKGK